jgi:hypothetical protein
VSLQTVKFCNLVIANVSLGVKKCVALVEVYTVSETLQLYNLTNIKHMLNILVSLGFLELSYVLQQSLLVELLTTSEAYRITGRICMNCL